MGNKLYDAVVWLESKLSLLAVGACLQNLLPNKFNQRHLSDDRVKVPCHHVRIMMMQTPTPTGASSNSLSIRAPLCLYPDKITPSSLPRTLGSLACGHS
jgi:hypothetical protein